MIRFAVLWWVYTGASPTHGNYGVYERNARFRIWALGVQYRTLRFEVWDLGFGCQSLGFGVWGFEAVGA